VRRAADAGDLATFIDMWSAALPVATPLLSLLTSGDQLLVNEVARVRCGIYVDGRTALIGDAAHAMAPNLGQGANSGLVDAAVLATELARHPDQASGLAAYDRARRGAVGKVQQRAEHLARLAHVRGRAARRLRDQVVSGLSRPKMVEKQIRAAQQIEPAAVRAAVAALHG
jgi:2-polyprenyl-6-methoxyphenol hydroxylase-like FAD-dependent oxidoreductase